MQASRPIPDPATDAELMRATRRGDRDAFAQLVDRHKDALVNYLTRLTGCRERAQDLAQESFLRLYQSAGRYDERGQLKALLYRIATNQLRSELRRERRFRLLAPFLIFEDSQRPEAAARLLQQETRRRLADAITTLPLLYRVPLVLHDVEGWPYADIAAHLGCREGTVKSRIHRARKRLKDHLAPYWQGPARWPAREELNGEMP